MKIRSAEIGDEPFLWEMLTYAASMPGPREDAIASAKQDRNLEGYVRGWGREGDVGVIATADDGAPIGAAWLRAGKPGMPDAPPSPLDLAELAIAVREGARAAGLGTTMLRALIERATPRYRVIVLSVRSGNPAVRLYERHGFVVEGEITNRVGTRSYAMRLDLGMRYTGPS